MIDVHTFIFVFLPIILSNVFTGIVKRVMQTSNFVNASHVGGEKAWFKNVHRYSRFPHRASIAIESIE